MRLETSAFLNYLRVVLNLGFEPRRPCGRTGLGRLRVPFSPAEHVVLGEGIAPTRSCDHCGLNAARLLLRHPSIPSSVRESNPQVQKDTSTSNLRVYQFRQPTLSGRRCRPVMAGFKDPLTCRGIPECIAKESNLDARRRSRLGRGCLPFHQRCSQLLAEAYKRLGSSRPSRCRKRKRVTRGNLARGARARKRKKCPLPTGGD
jgi:hypothetical protein